MLLIIVLAAISAFILFVLGILSYANVDKRYLSLGWPIAFVPALFGIGLNCYTIVDQGSMGVQITFGTVNSEPLTPGLHVVNPLCDIKTISTRLRKETLEHAQASTKDMQLVHTDITVNYHIQESDVVNIYSQFGFDVTDKVLFPSISESFKSVTAHYTSEELVTKREEVSAGIREELSNKLSQYGILINDVSLVNFGFSEQYQQAIEQKVIALQSRLKADQDLLRIKIEADQVIAKARGEAESIRIQSEAVQSQGGQSYVDLKAIEKWNGVLPQTTLGSNQPFISLNSKGN